MCRIWYSSHKGYLGYEYDNKRYSETKLTLTANEITASLMSEMVFQLSDKSIVY